MRLGDRSFVGHDNGRLATVAVVIALVATVYVTVGLVVVLPLPDSDLTRVAFVALAVGIAWVGAVAAVFDRPPVVILAAVVLVLLGFWQAVLWIFMLPAAVGLVVAGVTLAHSP